MNIVEKNIADIKPYGNNPRKNDSAVAPVANSIRIRLILIFHNMNLQAK